MHERLGIVVLGDINLDILGRVKSWPEPGDDCLAPSLELHCGGVGANCALALQQWGVEARLVGCVGEDYFGDYALDGLRKGGLDVSWIQRTGRAATGLIYINITPEGQRTFFGSRGANGQVQALRDARKICSGATAAHLMGYNFLDSGPERAAKQLMKQIRARGGWISLDAGMAASKGIPRKLLQMSGSVDILFLSEDEAAALTGNRNARKAMALLQQAGAREIVLKYGKRGCLIGKGGELQAVPPFSVHTVDSTGAGDAFAAAFLQARLRGWTNDEAAVAANAAGAAAAAIVGAGEQLPGMRDIAARLRSQRLPGSWDLVRKSVLRKMQFRSTNRNLRREK